MPSTVAARKCAGLVFVPPSFDVNREVSRQVQAIFKAGVKATSLTERGLLPPFAARPDMGGWGARIVDGSQ